MLTYADVCLRKSKDGNIEDPTPEDLELVLDLLITVRRLRSEPQLSPSSAPKRTKKLPAPPAPVTYIHIYIHVYILPAPPPVSYIYTYIYIYIHIYISIYTSFRHTYIYPVSYMYVNIYI